LGGMVDIAGAGASPLLLLVAAMSLCIDVVAYIKGITHCGNQRRRCRHELATK
jgi:hypothetical protein